MSIKTFSGAGKWLAYSDVPNCPVCMEIENG